MLCSNCHKKIPQGQEIQRGSSVAWRSGWVQGGYGSEIVCLRCSIIIKNKNRKFFIIFFSIFALFWIIFFTSFIWKEIINKN